MEDQLMDAVSAHLQFLGYETEPQPDGWLLATHAARPDFFLRAFPLGLRCVATFGVGELTAQGRQEWLRFANHRNDESVLARFALTGHGLDTTLRASALFPPTYDRIHFGRLLDMWHHELGALRDAPARGREQLEVAH